MRHHWPILRTALAALAPWVLITWIHWDAVAAVTLSLTSVTWLLAGALYTQLVEYWSHRVPMHRGLPHLTHVRWNHLEHHRIFHGTNFQTRDVEDRAHIAGRFWVFPILFLVHYAALVFVIEAQALIVFLLGTVLHYLVFEASHWLTHIEDNPVDRLLARIPLVSELRAYQIEHHRIHHEVPEMAFNFNPPYLGDRIAGHMPNRAEAWAGGVAFETPEAALVPTVALQPPRPIVEARFGVWRRRLVRYGSAAAVGVALVGAVVVAHGLLTRGPSPEQTA